MKKPISAPPSKGIQNKEDRNASSRIVKAEYRGPIPPPNILKGYDEIHAGFADRIVKMAEAESLHRRAMEQKAFCQVKMIVFENNFNLLYAKS